MKPFTREEIEDIIEHSKSDDALIAGSEIRQLGRMALRSLDREGWVSVPKEPTKEMLDAALRSMGAYIEPYDPQYEEGVQVDCGMSQEDADHINEQQREALAEQYRAQIAAAPGAET